MPYGQIKVDEITFTNAGVDQTISVSGVVASISGNITATGTISGNVIRGGTTVSGATVTGTAGQFGTITGNTAGFTTVTGTTVTGTTATFTSGVFTNISGGTHTITSGVFASGTAANPSITFQGDVNTGIYSPGADQVAISTNGTGRLFVNSSGSVGIGTSAPRSLLSLSSSTGSDITLERSGTTVIASDNYGTISWYGNDATGGASGIRGSIQGLSRGSSGEMAITFSTASAGGSSTERMRIEATGNVGIGTSSPGALLDLAGGAIRLNSTHGIYKANADGYAYFSGGTGLTAGGTIFCFGESHAGNANEIHFRNSSNLTRAVIDSSGRVGIGTTSPARLLHVASSAADGAIAIDGGSGNAAFLDFRIAGTNKHYIGSANLLGSGTNSDMTVWNSANGYLNFGTNGTERFRCDSSGRLLVGTSSSASDSVLQIQGTAGAPTAQGAISLRRGYTPISDLAAGSTIGKIDFEVSNGGVGARIAAEGDAAMNTNDYPSRLVFSTTADGASSPTERMRIPNGGGLSIGSSQNPNALIQASGLRLGNATLASYDFVNVTTSPVTIANGVGIGGLAFVQAYNTSTGAQYTGIIMWRSGVVAVVSESNSLGFALTYSVSGSTLRLQTASGTITGNVFSISTN